MATENNRQLSALASGPGPRLPDHSRGPQSRQPGNRAGGAGGRAAPSPGQSPPSPTRLWPGRDQVQATRCHVCKEQRSRFLRQILWFFKYWQFIHSNVEKTVRRWIRVPGPDGPQAPGRVWAEDTRVRLSRPHAPGPVSGRPSRSVRRAGSWAGPLCGHRRVLAGAAPLKTRRAVFQGSSGSDQRLETSLIPGRLRAGPRAPRTGSRRGDAAWAPGHRRHVPCSRES